MQQNQYDLYKQILLDRKEEILKILENLKNEFKNINKCDIKEEGDFASCSVNNENNFLIYKQQERELRQIEIALKELDEGTYGICKMCEEPINPERLKIKPFARYCIDCREFIEKNSKI